MVNVKGLWNQTDLGLNPHSVTHIFQLPFTHFPSVRVQQEQPLSRDVAFLHPAQAQTSLVFPKLGQHVLFLGNWEERQSVRKRSEASSG